MRIKNAGDYTFTDGDSACCACSHGGDLLWFYLLRTIAGSQLQLYGQLQSQHGSSDFGFQLLTLDSHPLASDSQRLFKKPDTELLTLGVDLSRRTDKS